MFGVSVGIMDVGVSGFPADYLVIAGGGAGWLGGGGRRWR